MEDFPRTKTFI